MTEASIDRGSRGGSQISQMLRQIGVDAATVHLLQKPKVHLQLYETFGLPPALMELIEVVPRGKGLAGEAWRRNAIVSSCNLAEDERAGVGARSLAFTSTYAVPMHQNGKLIGILGLAYVESTTLDPKRCASLAAQVVELLSV